MIKLVIVDFDGTLCLTEKIYFSIKNQIAGEMGFPPMTREEHKKSFDKTSLREAILERFPGIDFDAFIERMRKEVPRLAACNEIDAITPENLATLDRVMALGKKLALLTGRQLSEIEHLVAAEHPLNTRMEKFYHRDNLEHMKPDPKVFNQPLKDFNVRPEEAVYVGDILHDAAAAKGAGLHFIAVLEEGIKTKKDFVAFPVDFFADKFSDIVKYIKEH